MHVYIESDLGRVLSLLVAMHGIRKYNIGEQRRRVKEIFMSFILTPLVDGLMTLKKCSYTDIEEHQVYENYFPSFAPKFALYIAYHEFCTGLFWINEAEN